MTWPPALPRRAVAGAAATTLALAASGCGGGDQEFAPSESTAAFQLKPLSPEKPDFTIGAVDILEPGKQIEIVELRPIGTPNVAYLGAITVWPRDKDSSTEAALGFPGKGVDRYHQAIGTVVPAAETAFKDPGQESPHPLWVGAGFRLLSGTVGGVFDVEVSYRVDGVERTRRAGATFLVCTSPCEGNKYKDVNAWAEVVRKDLGVKEIETDRT
ncbi:MAG: hypothetical protein ACT4QF_14195 [Sporichthyaceae bacterium]